jgi:Putative restriction endonuclease
MVAAREHLSKFTLDEYFAWEEQQEVKHEYFEGEVYAVSGGTQNHSRVGGRLFSLVDLHLDNRHHRAKTGKLYAKAESFTEQAFQNYLLNFTRNGRNSSKLVACFKFQT